MIRMLSAVIVALCLTQSALAIVAAPNVFYDFDNQEAQGLGTYDGQFTEQMGTGLHIWNNERNGAGGQPFSFFLTGGSACNGYGGGCDGGVNAAPREHYVTGPTSGLGNVLGTAHHFEGGRHRTYDPNISGTAALSAQLDLPETLIVNDIFSRRDMGRLGGPSSGNFPHTNSSGDGFGGATVNGGVLAYNMWLNVQLATSTQDNTRFGSGTSMVIGRGSDAPGYGGEVGLRDADGDGGTTNYKPQFRNDGGPNGIQQTSFVFGNGEWHHFLVQYDLTGATGTVTVWIDGGPSEGGSKEVLTGFGNAQIKGVTFINQVGHPGASFRETGDFYLDDLAIWNNHLFSDAEAAELYNKGVALSQVPEPSSFALAGLGLVGLTWFGWRKRRA